MTFATVPAELWPKAESTNFLASEAEKQKKIGVRSPFIYADLAKFLPIWIMDSNELIEYNDEAMAEEQSFLAKELSKAMGSSAAPKKTRGTYKTLAPYVKPKKKHK